MLRRFGVGLAGPTWGLGAAVAAYLAHLATADPFWAALARFGAWINLFNLLPVWQLDGGHAFRALSRSQRWIVAAVLGGMWFLTTEGLLVVHAWGGEAPEEGDARPGPLTGVPANLGLASRSCRTSSRSRASV